MAHAVVKETFPSLLLKHAKERPTQAAMREKDLGIWQTFTWGDVAEQVKLVANTFLDLGVQKGEHIGIVGENRPRLYMAMMAAQSVGAIPVPMYQDAIAQEMVHVLKDADLRIVVVENQEQVDKMLEVRVDVPTLECVIYDDPRGLRNYQEGMILSYDKVLERGERFAKNYPDAFMNALTAVQPEDAAAMFYTSGTTGKPKGVVLTHAALIDRAQVIERMEKLTHKEEVLAYLPPAWIGQNMFSYAQALTTGFTVNHPESPSTVSIDMHDIGPTYYFSPPRVLEELLTQVTIRMEDAGKFKQWLFKKSMNLAKRVGTKILDKESVGLLDRIKYMIGDFVMYAPLRNALGMSRVRVAYTAGEAIGPDLFTFYRSIGINLKQLYGSTETSVFVCVQKDGHVYPDSVGAPVEGVEIRIADNGEVQVKSPGLFKEYYRNPESTAESFTEDGWYHTGDAGFIDHHGDLKIIDRAKDVGRLVDGRLFAPKYVENKLKFFPYIKEAVAFGANKEFVTAFINIDLEAVANWAERRGLAYAGYTDLASKPEVYQLIGDCIDQVNVDVAQDEQLQGLQIHRFLILHKELDPDDDELTRTRKVRRNFIAEKYKVLIDALFEGKPSQYIETEVKYEDGRKGKISADLKIAPAKVVNTAKAA
ncbi:long-chain fatty acid--CoA ligase [Pelistega indica]|uniref:Long-chain fatty acid--CoA ligase n=1 Tax=Pelistega indica TaxID=1414851 RepID=V8FVI0_9BURK|nr:AMP-binding protein [Pelistega indica]ETD67881.1 long-chain fatty acid--CoA ligase [Pelistega indica]